MQLRTSTLVWFAAGLFAVGTGTGLSGPTLLKSAGTPTAGPALSDSNHAIAPAQIIPPATAPNYRAIVAGNQAAVVGITTAGIVSAKGRSLPGDGYVPFIQTDAAVNPGNSGGYQGVSFAIPINLAVQVKDQIVKTGKVAHSLLGVEVQTLDQSLANSFKLKSPNRALVAKVAPDSAADRAGIKVRDYSFR